MAITKGKASYSTGGATWTRKSRHDLWTGEKRSTKAADEWAGDQHYREMDAEVGRWGDAANKNNAQYVIQPFYNRSEVTKRALARRVFVLVSLLLVAPLTSDRDGDR
jgi:hypothetical protein